LAEKGWTTTFITGLWLWYWLREGNARHFAYHGEGRNVPLRDSPDESDREAKLFATQCSETFRHVNRDCVKRRLRHGWLEPCGQRVRRHDRGDPRPDDEDRQRRKGSHG
jgi:hypothetical protein